MSAGDAPPPLQPTITGDRLYGVSLRPQELALYRERAEIALRYRAIYDDPTALATEHFKLLVVEVSAQLSSEDDLAQEVGSRLELLKCGWELSLTTATPQRVDALPELPEELPHLLGRIAETVNALAERAHLEEPPLGEEMVEALVAQYRSQHPPPA